MKFSAGGARSGPELHLPCHAKIRRRIDVSGPVPAGKVAAPSQAIC